MDQDQDQGIQGTGVPQDPTTAIEEMKQESQTLAEKSKTVDERLDNYLNPKAETDNQPEPMPSSNQTQTEESKPLPEPSNAQETEQPKLPDSASDRTKEQFEKLLEENRRLKEERRKAAGDSVFDSLRGEPEIQPTNDRFDFSQFNNLTNAQADQITKDFISPDGTVDVDGLNKALAAANDRATIAETEARMATDKVQQFLESQQVREAHKEYPELDPKQPDKFDPNFFDLVALRLAKDKLNNRGKQTLTLAEAAAQVRQSYTPQASTVNLDKVRDEAISQYKSAQDTKKSQQPLSSGQGEPRTTVSVQDLRNQTRQKGDITTNKALDERLRKAGIIT